MKILSRMLSRKIEPQEGFEMDEEAARDALDDAGQVQSARRQSAALSEPIKPKPEEPEVAGSGWAAGGDWDDDWDDDDDWGDEDDPDFDMEERRKTQDKQHLVSEIREAMTSVSAPPAAPPAKEPEAARPKSERGEWSDDDEFGRQARARSQLTEATDENEDRLMEKTETVMSDRETSRRRSAMAHMKAAAAATKADRVLRHVASQDPSSDPAEQSPYRDDLAKVVRPHSSSRPISRQVSRPSAPSAVWDQGVGDEDAALFAASEGGMTEDPSVSIDNEMSAAEELRLSRAPTELSEEDFAEDELDTPQPRAARDFPSSRFAVPLEEDDEHNAFDDVAEDIASVARHGDDYDDPFGDHEDDDLGDADMDEDAPQPSSVVAEAVAFANEPDEKPKSQPEAEVRKKIWEMADEVAAEVESSREEAEHAPAPAPEPQPEAPAESMLDVSAAVAGRAGRSAGRVKTRLLGFQADDEQKDPFASAAAAEGRAPVVADKFPTGWIVVIEGPGRGASFAVHAGVSQIGRGEDQTVRLDFGDTSISRNNHAAVAFDTEQSKFFLGHGGKSNLVRLNGKPVLSTEEMANGDEIRIGETLLKFVAFCGDEFSWTGKGANGEDA